MNIYVTKPSLPDLDELIPAFRDIWSTKQLTNFGPYYYKFQNYFADKFNCPKPILTSSGNGALSIACCAAFNKGEVITTPYSFVATSNVIMSIGCTPVYADICPKSFSISPDSVEKLVTKNTTGILATHCYGIPGDLDGLALLSKKYSLPLIYDCAHGIGVKSQGRSLCSYGDISCLSFHATKLFNTFEGGAVITSNPDLQDRLKRISNFGILDEFDCDEVGTNVKMNELAAAIGYTALSHLDSWIQRRKYIYSLYENRLSVLSNFELPYISPEDHNYSYMPILCKTNDLRERALKVLRDKGIVARRYFYPIIPLMSAYKQYQSQASSLPIALDVSMRVLCLPIYPDLFPEHVELICSSLANFE
tara:strand:- start:481 stop:1572 length:1092 start_codon:yes stop_codon:yes gene_type:complete